MEARRGGGISIMGLCSCMVTGAVVAASGCGVMQGGNNAVATYRVLSNVDDGPDLLAHHYLSMYNEHEIDIGLPPE